MATKIDIVVEAVDNLSATVKKIENNVGKMTRSIQNDAQKVAVSTHKMSAQTTKSLNNMNTAFGEVSTNMRRIGALVGSIYAIRSAMMGLASVADDFKEFNEAMAYVNTIAQMTDESLAKLTAQVEDLSVALGKSAPELAKGLYDIYSSGFEGAEAMQVLEVATQGAIAGLTNVGVAAKGLMAVMNAYNRKTGADAIDIMNVMFKTVDKGVITFEQLASEIGSVVTMSSQLGIPFEQIGAAMSVMTLRGVSAAESATALEGLMRSIMKPADQAKKATEKLGIEWNVASLRAKGLSGMIKDLSDATQGNFEVIGQIIPEIRGMRAAMVLLSEDGDEFVRMLDIMALRSDSYMKAMAKANESVSRQLETAKSEWETYSREVGGAIANVQLLFYKSLISFSKWVSEHEKGLKIVAKTVTSLTIAFISLKASMLGVAGAQAISTYATAFSVINANISKTALATAGLETQVITLKKVISSAPKLVLFTAIIYGATQVILKIIELNKLIQNTRALAGTYGEMAIGYSKDAKTLRESGDAELQALAKIENQKAIISARLQQVNANIAEEGGFNALGKSIISKDYNEYYNKLISDRKSLNKELISLNKEAEDATKNITPGKLSSLLDPLPEYEGFGNYEDLLGSDGLDKEAQKIADTIEKITKRISDFYVEVGDSANDYTKSLEDQADAFEKASLKWGRYLQDMDTDLTRMEEKHKQVIGDIQDDIADENRTFAESMDDRLRKFNDTMSSMKTNHTDKVDDLQHQIDLEMGMGIRADKEKLAELQKRLERENRDYANKIAKDKEEKEIEDARDREGNVEKLSDFQTRLDREKISFTQNTDDMKKELDRQTNDYATAQNNILIKTQETWTKIGDNIAKDLAKIVESIQDSGIASAFTAQLSQVYSKASGLELPGAGIVRNKEAEIKEIEGMGGYEATQEYFDKVNLGVYGTTDVPWSGGGGVTVNVYNPVVTDDAFVNPLAEQINIKIGEAQRLEASGAY